MKNFGNILFFLALLANLNTLFFSGINKSIQSGQKKHAHFSFTSNSLFELLWEDVLELNDPTPEDKDEEDQNDPNSKLFYYRELTLFRCFPLPASPVINNFADPVNNERFLCFSPPPELA